MSRQILICHKQMHITQGDGTEGRLWARRSDAEMRTWAWVAMNSSLWGNVFGAYPLLLLCLGLLAGALANDSDAEVASFFSDEVETRRLEALRAACGELCNTSAPVRFYFCDPTPEHPCLQDVGTPTRLVRAGLSVRHKDLECASCTSVGMDVARTCTCSSQIAPPHAR